MVGIDLEGPFQLQWFPGHADLWYKFSVDGHFLYSVHSILSKHHSDNALSHVVLCGATSWTQWFLWILSSSGYSVILWFCGPVLEVTGKLVTPWSLLIGLHGFLYHCNNFCLSFLPFMELPNLPDFPFYLDLFYTQFHLPIMEVYKTLLPWSPLILFYYSTYFS